MAVDAPTLLQRLNGSPDDSPVASLVELVLEQLLDSKVSSWLTHDTLARSLKQCLQGWLDSDSAVKMAEDAVEQQVNRLSASSAPLLPAQLKHALLELAERPYSPDRRVVLKILDRAPMRELIRGLVLDTVTAFGARMTAPAASVTKGLGGLARFAAETVKQRGGTLGELVGAAQSQVEKRSAEFADATISSVINEIADAVCDPKRASEAAELRVEAVKGALELTRRELARELMNLDISGGAEVLRSGLKRWIESSDSNKVFEELAKTLQPDKSLRDVLQASGLLDPVTTMLRSGLRMQFEQLFKSSAFARWLETLMSGG